MCFFCCVRCAWFVCGLERVCSLGWLLVFLVQNVICEGSFARFFHHFIKIIRVIILCLLSFQIIQGSLANLETVLQLKLLYAVIIRLSFHLRFTSDGYFLSFWPLIYEPKKFLRFLITFVVSHCASSTRIKTAIFVFFTVLF